VHATAIKRIGVIKPRIGGGSNGKHLSYIDICISSSKGGGGKKGPK
jgi:hypothetical protein